MIVRLNHTGGMYRLNINGRDIEAISIGTIIEGLRGLDVSVMLGYMPLTALKEEIRRDLQSAGIRVEADS
jgi:hypothetical protein